MTFITQYWSPLEMSRFPNVDELRIIYYPDPRLRQAAAPVAQIEDFHRELAERMAELMTEVSGVGLAANQAGWLERIVVLDLTGEPGKVEAFVNPSILSSSGTLTDSEGCLSVPGIRAKVRRAAQVRVSATRLTSGEQVEIEAAGLLARAWQHEIDHLNGVLFLNRLGVASRVMIAYRLRRLEKVYKEALGG